MLCNAINLKQGRKTEQMVYKKVLKCYAMLIAVNLKQGSKTEQIVYKQYENVMQCYPFKIGEENRANSI